MIYQKNFFSCGEACARNVICKLRGRKAGSMYLGECTNFSLIKDNLKKYGISSVGYEFQNVDNIRYLKGKKIILISKNTRNHFVYYMCQFKHFVIFFDPEDGIKIKSKKEFKKLSLSKLLNCYKTSDTSIDRIAFLERKEVFMLSLVSILSGILILMTIFLWKQHIKIDVAIGLFLGLLILSFINQSYLLTLLRRLQRRIGWKYIQKECSSDSFREINDFQTNIVKYYSSHINGIVGLTVILVLCFFINPIDILLIFTSVLISYIIYILGKRKRDRLNQKMEQAERKMFKCHSSHEEDYYRYSSMGEKYGKYALIEIYVRICVIACLTIIECFLLKEMSFAVIFSKAIMVYYLNAKIFDFISTRQQSNPFIDLTKLDCRIYDNTSIFKKRKKS